MIFCLLSSPYEKGSTLKGKNVCFTAHQAPSKKRIYFKREEFALKGSKVFPFKIDPSQKGVRKIDPPQKGVRNGC